MGLGRTGGLQPLLPHNRLSNHNIGDLPEAMTPEEQVSLLSGADFWSVAGVDRLDPGPPVFRGRQR